MRSGGQTAPFTPLPCTKCSLKMQRRSKVQQFLKRGRGGAAALCSCLLLQPRMENCLPAAPSKLQPWIQSLFSCILSVPSSLPPFHYLSVICTLVVPHVALHPAALHGQTAGQKGGILTRPKPHKVTACRGPQAIPGSYAESLANPAHRESRGTLGPGGKVRTWATCIARPPPVGVGT